MVDQRSDAKPNPCDGETPVRATASEAGKPASRRTGSLALDPDARILFLDDRPLPLGERAISILLMLVERSGQVVSKEELVSAIWPGLAVEDSSLTDQIAALRRVLGWSPAEIPGSRRFRGGAIASQDRSCSPRPRKLRLARRLRQNGILQLQDPVCPN